LCSQCSQSFGREPLLVGPSGVSFHGPGSRVTQDGGDLMLGQTGLGEPRSERLAKAMKGASAWQASLLRPALHRVANTRHGVGLAM